jgi:hypothetical protein
MRIDVAITRGSLAWCLFVLCESEVTPRELPEAHDQKPGCKPGPKPGLEPGIGRT